MHDRCVGGGGGGRVDRIVVIRKWVGVVGQMLLGLAEENAGMRRRRRLRVVVVSEVRRPRRGISRIHWNTVRREESTLELTANRKCSLIRAQI